MKKLLKLSLLPMSLLLSTTALAQQNCPASVVMNNSWGTAAQYSLSITNGSTPVTSWEVCMSLSGNETLLDVWVARGATTGTTLCFQNQTYNGNIAANGTLSNIEFQLSSPSGQVPTVISYNGVACGNGGTTPSSAASSTTSTGPVPVSSAASSVAVSSSAPISSAAPVSSSAPVSSAAPSSSGNNSSVPANPDAATWLINTDKSTFYFVPVKNTNTAENFTFTEFDGSVAADGSATLRIPLTSISSGNNTRNTRMRNILWEIDFFPNLYFTTTLNLTEVNAMPAGSILTKTIIGNLTLHAVRKAVTFDAVIVKHSDNSVSVSPRRPIIVNSADFDLNAGVEGLRVAARQTTIGEKTPVYFKMFLTRDNPQQVAPISIPAAPEAPVSLDGNISAVTADASLVWTDMSNNETGFAVRRLGADGRWSTQSNLPANSVDFTESLLEAPGAYSYKVIAFNEGVPSLASNLVSLEYVDPNPSSSDASSVATSSAGNTSSNGSGASSSDGSSGEYVGDMARGEQLWTDRGCIDCHGVDGEKNANGSFADVSVNPNREVYRHSQDTQGRALFEFIDMWMPQGNTESCKGQCAADLETYIRSWRRPSDGIPDKPVSVFSCPSDATTYGQRTLRLLTKSEFQRSVRDLVNYQAEIMSRLPDDFIAGYFTNNNTLLIDRSRYTIYLATAERIADDVATRWNSVLSCTPSSSCATRLVDTLAPRIFRRPLTTEERTSYLAVAQGTEDGRTAEEGMKVALTAMFSSPQFLYRSEVGEAQGGGIYKLTAHELATYISYTYTGTTPSDTLLAAAANGSLNTPQGIRQQVSALLNTPAANTLMDDLINRWLGTEQLEIKDKDGFPNFAQLAEDMKKEVGKNFAHAMLNSTTDFASLYTPNYTHVNQRLASLYGLSYSGSPDADGFVRVSSPNHGGVLTTGAFMSRYATSMDANMITRAVALRRRLMCQDIPEPPNGVSLDREALFARDREFFENPHTTQRMMYDRITAGTTCANCHGEIINQVGGGMENYDAMGRVRAVDLKGNPINAVGTFFSPYPQLQFLNDPDRVIHSPAIVFEGGQGLANTIVNDPLVSGLAQSCLATQMVSYSSGIHAIFLMDSDRDVGYARISKQEEDAIRCGIESLTNTLVSQGPRAMLEAIPTLDSVIYRQEWAR